ncbi:DUF2637 domain-containing protein [Streptosporangium sp. NPDC001559]|uniref:DUF2637 domain-containing protein n=1 Tax=Streptosporangium sp. NPDC001559 TaxID=3366187 RepID=UPI0036EBD45D
MHDLTEPRPATLGQRAHRLLTTLRRRPAATPQNHPQTAPATHDQTGTSIMADRVIRGVAITILLAVAAAAAYVSYHHFYGLAIALGERRDMAILYPAMSDGVIVMASLVMVYCSRRRMPVPAGAWLALILGCTVTLVANVAHGWHGGTGSRLLSALAPVAFVGAYELLMWLVRTARRAAVAVEETPVSEPVEEHVCQPETVVETVTVVERVVPLDRFEAARLAYEDSLKPGCKRIGWRPLSNRWGIEVGEAKEIIAEVDRERTEQAAAEPEQEAEPATAQPLPVPLPKPPAASGEEAAIDHMFPPANPGEWLMGQVLAESATASVNGSHHSGSTGGEA